MELVINGEVRFTHQTTLQNVLHELGYDPRYVAVAINEQFVPRSAFLETRLAANDRVEVVAPMQGG